MSTSNPAGSASGSAQAGDSDNAADEGFRACDTCRRLKVRCIDRSRPPCKRCEHLGLMCTTTHTGPIRRRDAALNRLQNVEKQVNTVQGKLEHLASLIETRLPVQPGSSPLTAQPASEVRRQSFHMTASINSAPSAHERLEEVVSNTARSTSGPAHSPLRAVSTSMDSPPAENLDEEPVSAHVAYFRSLLQVPNERGRGQDGQDMDASLTWWTGSEDLSFQDINSVVFDPVTLEICDLAWAQTMFDLFFEKIHPYNPLFDPSRDTWQNLLHRSPFCVTTILYTAAKVSNESPDLTKKLRIHAMRTAKSTLFSHLVDLETVQALMVLAWWTEPYWRMIQHAVSLAVELELYDCTRKLNQGHQQDIVRLTAGARVWAAVCKLALETCNNYTRASLFDPSLMADDFGALLASPAGLPSDTRLVACVELQLIRRPLDMVMRNLSRSDPTPMDQLRTLYQKIELWESKWTRYYQRRGFGKDHFFVTELVSQRAYSFVFFSSFLLRYLHSPGDVEKLDPESQLWLHKGLEAGMLVLDRIVGGREIEHLPYANHYGHLSVAVTLRLIIRLVKFMPYAVDLGQTAQKAQKLAEFLSNLPGVGFGRELLDVLKRAREHHILPGASAIGTTTEDPPDQMDQDEAFRRDNRFLEFMDPFGDLGANEIWDLHRMFEGE